MLHILRKGKITKRVMAFALSLLMVASLLPGGLLGGAFEVKAATTVYKFDAAELTAAADKEAVEAGSTYADGYFKVFGTATKRTNSDGSVKSVEIGKNATGGFEFTITGTATVKIATSSTGGSNTSTIALLDEAGNVVANKEGLEEVKTSTATNITYELEAGTYKFVSPESDYNRGARVYTIEVEEVATSTTTVYSFAASDLTAAADKEAVEDGTKVADGFIKIYGTVTKRTNSDGSVKSIEIGKNATGGLEFTITGTATVKIATSSTGGSNTSTIALLDGAGNVVANKEGLEEVKTSTATDISYELTAGTYKFVSPQSDYNRGARVYSVEIEEVVVASKTTEYAFAASDLTAAADKEAVEDGTKVADGFIKIYGTVTKRTNSDGSVKSIEIGKNATGGLEFTITGTATVKIATSSTGGSNTSTIALLDETGNVVANKEGLEEVKTSTATDISYELTAGTYKFVSPQSDYNRGARVYSVNITETTGGERPARKTWDKVVAPAITGITTEDGKITVTFDMVIGYDGADSVKVKMMAGEAVVETKAFADTSENGQVVFTPSESGTYTFSILAVRDGETDKEGEASESVVFSLPLKTPVISSATSIGDGKVDVVWGAVPEAEKYEVYCDGKLAGTTEKTSYTVTDLTIGTKYAFTVVAVRGEDKSDASAAKNTTVTKEAKQVWGTTIYGPSTSSSSNGVVGDLNEDGKVTVYSEGGKGKIVPNSTDGIAFYYTAIPVSLNFTLRAKVTVDSWTLSNGQEGFGLMAADRLGENGASNVWNNQYMALASKVEYTGENGVKYTMKMGLGVIEKLGVTKDNLDLFNKSDTATIQNEFKTSTTTLEYIAAEKNLEKATYNIVGNATKEAEGTIAEITEFILEIQKNNTGYFVTYYDAEGNIINRVKYYDTDALSQLDSENVYVGFFAARNARATFSDVELTTIDPKDDAPAEEKPVTKIEPTVNVQSAGVANTEKYTLLLIPNVDGTAIVKMGDEVIASDLVLKGGVKFSKEITLPSTSKNEIVIEFTPDPNQEMEEDTVLASTDKVTVKLTVTRCTRFENRNNIYVSPDGLSGAKGSKLNPVDIYTAVKYAQPGQTIIIMEGTYLLSSTVRIERGINGTADAPIRMIADPAAKTRPVFDFQSKCAGMVFGGDYWYFSGFDVTKSANAQKGIQVSGNNNVLDSVNAYYNGNTGIQISRLFSADKFEDWPANNLILNCTSYGNADAGYEDADGFAAKLTVGEGNVFDGCVAYNNADDGWDLYAKVETGAIGSVTIQNCVAYLNGYLEDGTNAGNGNGFKMGGESISGKHVLKNSYAFFNKAKGIDSNSCPDILVYNSIAYNNESYNVAFYTNNAANTDFFATGILSFKDETVKSGLTTGENLKNKGTQDTTKYLGVTNFYWDGGKSANSAGDVVDASWFKSLTFTKITRNEDGTINMNGFLELTDKVPEGVGAVPAGQASEDNDVKDDTKPEMVTDVVVKEDTKVEDLLAEVDSLIEKAEKENVSTVPVLKLEVEASAKVADELLAGIAGKEVVVRLDLGNGIAWDIYGKDVKDEATGADMTVTIGGDAIPKQELAKVEELGALVSLSIAHDGQFGFDATMKYAVGEANNGKHATLFWYHDGVFEKAGSFIIEDGNAEFVLSHASEYVMVISDAEISTDIIGEKGDMTALPFVMLILLGLVMAVVGFFTKKKYSVR